MHTIASAFDPKHNSLNAIRLALAVLVIVSHSWPIGGYGRDPGYGDQHLGEWAVAGFFAISGYLITSSRLSANSIWDYLWRRFLRVYPAFIVAFIVVGFVIAPIWAMIAGQNDYSWGSAFGYVINNSAVSIQQWGIAGKLSDAPHATSWNGSAWTLFYEVLCYLGVGVLVSVAPARYLKIALIAAMTLCFAVTIAVHNVGIDLPTTVEVAARLGGFFVAGAILFLYREQISLNWAGAGIALAILIGGVLGHEFQALAGLPIAYLMIFLGTRLPLQHIGKKNDVSYGMYIYAFPVQQLLAEIFPDQQLPLVIFVLFSIALTTPFAVASWFLIEKPLHRYRGLLSRSQDSRPASAPEPVRLPTD